jgi:CBS domain-containing protein
MRQGPGQLNFCLILGGAVVKVKDAMQRSVICLESNASITKIAECMRETESGAVPIRHGGNLIGIVTDRDIARQVLADPDNVNKTIASDIMTREIVSCSPDDDLRAAFTLMELNRIRLLPVLDREKNLIGTLSLDEISNKIIVDLSGESFSANVDRVSDEHERWLQEVLQDDRSRTAAGRAR